MRDQGRIGVLALNLGSPDAPTVPAVGTYLREFLSDERVIDTRAPVRWGLLNLAILPFRPKRSAAQYRKVWTDRGSPLKTNTEAFREKLASQLGQRFKVVLAMRYGRPSIASALDRFAQEGLKRIVVLPLYPQSAASSTGSALALVYRLAAQRWDPPWLSVVGPFFDEPGFLDSFGAVGKRALEKVEPQVIVFSFHGLPERQIRKSDPTGAHCLASQACCEDPFPLRFGCYRAQCFATARGIAQRLGLPEGKWSVAFQSRLGRTPWLRPATDEVLVQLGQAGTKEVAVFCPTFVADCLETLEEIGIRGRESFLGAGGERLTLVPSLNDHPQWVETAASLVRRAAS